jgi:hypothetical protein
MDSFNYFNYFTEIEEHFWRKRGAHLLVSPLDWAIVETWQKAGVPLEAVLRGIDNAFESYQRSRRAARPLKSLAYCVDAVLDAAAQQAETAVGASPRAERASPQGESFSREDLAAFFSRNIDKLQQAAARINSPASPLAALISQAQSSLAAIATMLDAAAPLNLEEIERRLTVVEDRLTAAVTASADEETLAALRGELDRQLAPYRRRMTAAQISLLERQYLQKRLFERFDLPRLSLFYLM